MQAEPETTTGAGTLPLTGITVVDLSRVVAGPYCTMMLADLGATVIKIEHPTDPDYVRDFPPHVGGASAYFAQYNRHKLGASLDLKHPDGKALLLEMVRKADILVENFRPGTMDKLGLGWPMLQATNPRLIYTAVQRLRPQRPERAATVVRQHRTGRRRPLVDEWLPRPAPGACRQHHRRPRSIVLRDDRHARGAARGRAQRPRPDGRHLAAGLGGHADRERDRQLHGRRRHRPAARQRASVRPAVRPVSVQGWLRVLRFATATSCGATHARSSASRSSPTTPRSTPWSSASTTATYKRRIEPLIERWFMPRTKAELEAMAGNRIALTPIKSIDEVVGDPHLRERRMFVDVGMGDAVVKVFGLAAEALRNAGAGQRAGALAGPTQPRGLCRLVGDPCRAL